MLLAEEFVPIVLDEFSVQIQRNEIFVVIINWRWEAILKKSKKNRKRFNNRKNKINIIVLGSLETDRVDDRSYLKHSKVPDKITNISQHSYQKNGYTKPIKFKMPPIWQKRKKDYQSIITEYYRLLTESDLANSEFDVDRIQEILQEAESDDILSLFLNEVDNIIVQQSSSDVEDEERHADYQKTAEVLRIHADSCDQLSSEFSCLMTKISSLIGKIQAFKDSDIFDDSPESSQSIDTKVQSLTLLKEEAEVEQERRWLKYCLNDSEPQ